MKNEIIKLKDINDNLRTLFTIIKSFIFILRLYWKIIAHFSSTLPEQISIIFKNKFMQISMANYNKRSQNRRINFHQIIGK